MQKNMGMTQRVIWVVVGLLLIAWAIWGAPYAGGKYSWIGWIGVVPLVTGAIGWCALNALFGAKK